MVIPVLVEPFGENGFRAATGSPLGLECHAPTREQALEKLRGLIEDRLKAGAKIVMLKFPERKAQ